MLKIGKKEEIKAEVVESSFTLEHETEQKVLKVVREKAQLVWADVEDHIAALPSVSGALIAEIVQKVVGTLQEESLDSSLAFIFRLVAVQHDARELRHFLKHQFRVDGQLFLYLLWERREEAIALYLVEAVLDCYTAQLMLGDSQVLKLWQRHIASRTAFSQSRERVNAQLQARSRAETGSRVEGFRRVVVPL